MMNDEKYLRSLDTSVASRRSFFIPRDLVENFELSIANSQLSINNEKFEVPWQITKSSLKVLFHHSSLIIHHSPKPWGRCGQGCKFEEALS